MTLSLAALSVTAKAHSRRSTTIDITIDTTIDITITLDITAVPLLTPAGVADWVKYAVQLPEYAKAFEDNTVNWLDFSVLMQVQPSSMHTSIHTSTALPPFGD